MGNIKKRKGQAEIMGWLQDRNVDSNSPSTSYSACAKIIGIQNQSILSVKNLSDKRMKEYPIGSIMDVEYAVFPA